MTSIIFDIRNFASTDKFSRYFHSNQQVSVTFNNNQAIITSLQSGSTPGILVNDTYQLEPKTTYEFLVLGRSSSNVLLWCLDKTNNILINDGIQRLSDDNSANHMFVTNRTNKQIKAKFGMLFEKPAELGDQFNLEAIALIKRDGNVDGLWREFEHEDIILRDKWSKTESRWKATVTFTNAD